MSNGGTDSVCPISKPKIAGSTSLHQKSKQNKYLSRKIIVGVCTTFRITSNDIYLPSALPVSLKNNDNHIPSLLPVSHY